MKKYYMILVLCCFLLVCSKEPEIRFCETMSDNLSEMWSNSGKSLNYNELETKEFYIPLQWQRSFGGKTYVGKNGFVMLVKGELPLGIMNLKVIHISDDGKREKYFITPDRIQVDDPQANLRAFKIERLLSPAGELGASVLYTNDVEPGRYYFFLEKNDEELVGCEITIERVGVESIEKPMEKLFSKNEVELISCAKEFVTLLVEEDFTGVFAQFNSKMKSSMSEKELRNAWSALLKECGVFQKQGNVKYAEEKGYRIVYITCEFSQSAMCIKVVYDESGLVAGLWFIP